MAASASTITPLGPGCGGEIDESRYVTGLQMFVDGGASLKLGLA
ncbi:hypothetical protein [Nocardia sp. NPDC004750]